VILALFGCASRVAVGDGLLADVPAPEAYDAAVRAATRELRLYTDGLSTALLLRAAWLDPDFRRAQEALRAHLFLLDAPTRAARLDASLAEEQAHYVFVVAADSQWRDELNLAFDDSTPWRIRAFAGGRACTPEAVQTLEPTPTDHQLYPFLDRWSHSWTVRFARDCGDGPLVLQLAGPRGAGEVGW
jgi:hypothetical protein